jgi:hypothetical protein
MKPGEPTRVANDAIQARALGELPRWYNITTNQARRVWELLRRQNVIDLGYTQDPNGGYWIRQYDKEKTR